MGKLFVYILYMVGFELLLALLKVSGIFDKSFFIAYVDRVIYRYVKVLGTF